MSKAGACQQLSMLPTTLCALRAACCLGVARCRCCVHPLRCWAEHAALSHLERHLACRRLCTGTPFPEDRVAPYPE